MVGSWVNQAYSCGILWCNMTVMISFYPVATWNLSATADHVLGAATNAQWLLHDFRTCGVSSINSLLSHKACMFTDESLGMAMAYYQMWWWCGCITVRTISREYLVESSIVQRPHPLFQTYRIDDTTMIDSARLTRHLQSISIPNNVGISRIMNFTASKSLSDAKFDVTGGRLKLPCTTWCCQAHLKIARFIQRPIAPFPKIKQKLVFLPVICQYSSLQMTVGLSSAQIRIKGIQMHQVNMSPTINWTWPHFQA